MAGSLSFSFLFLKTEALQSVHTMGSVQEGGSYCEDQASTRALAGSVLETKSICGGTSSAGDRERNERDKDRDSASVRALAGSIGTDSLSARHLVQVDTHAGHQPPPRSDRGSPGENRQDNVPVQLLAVLFGNLCDACQDSRLAKVLSSIQWLV